MFLIVFMYKKTMAKRQADSECGENPACKRQCIAESKDANLDAGTDTANKTETVSDKAFFMFFDTETDGRGSFRPFRQTVVQVSWAITDETGSKLESFTAFVKGATALDYNPNHWTVEQVNEGVEPMEARNKFITALNRINKNEGYLVAHNIEFDISAMKSLGIPDELFKKTFCTKDKTTNICCIPAKRGFKWPSQLELHRFLFPDRVDTEQTHDAQDDVQMLRENFTECLRRARLGDARYSAFLVAP